MGQVWDPLKADFVHSCESALWPVLTIAISLCSAGANQPNLHAAWWSQNAHRSNSVTVDPGHSPFM